MRIEVDVRGIEAMKRILDQAGKQAPTAIARALNEAGKTTRTQIVRVLTQQTGLKRKVIVHALKEERARKGRLVYAIKTKGGDASLRYFNPRETPAGVTAAPRGKSQLYQGTFRRGGKFPNRVFLKKLNGHVYRRIGKGRKIAMVRSGVIIPKELVSGETATQFHATVQATLPACLEKELKRLFPAVPSGAR